MQHGLTLILIITLFLLQTIQIVASQVDSNHNINPKFSPRRKLKVYLASQGLTNQVLLHWVVQAAKRGLKVLI